MIKTIVFITGVLISQIAAASDLVAVIYTNGDSGYVNLDRVSYIFDRDDSCSVQFGTRRRMRVNGSCEELRFKSRYGK